MRILSKRIGVINDLHIPFHDQRALLLVLDVYKTIGIDEIILNGDIVDFINVSLHGPKHPDIKETIEDEIYQTIAFLKLLRSLFPKIKITYNAGNHEYRLDRWIMQKCPSFWNLVRLERLLQLEELKIDWNEYNCEYKVNDLNLYVQHSPPSYSVTAARASLLKKPDTSFIYACTHRRDYAVLQGRKGLYEVFMNGWLGSSYYIDHLQNRFSHRAFSFTKNHEAWNKCFAIIYDFGNTHDIKQFNIYDDYSCVVEGNQFIMPPLPIKDD